jgi:pheromone shutdown-related protein TraB
MLPESVRIVEENGKKYYLLGTAHVSKKSVEEVSCVIDEIQPDSVCIELCDKRFESLRNRDKWKNTDIFTIIKEKKVLLLMTNLIMSSFYRKLGKELDVTPGSEMLKGAEEAEKRGINLILADRNIDITLKRVWAGLSFWQKIKGVTQLFSMFFSPTEKIDETAIEEIKQDDNIGDAMDALAKEFPGIKSRLVDERDLYLAEKIRTAKGEKIVAVLGAAHCKGVTEHLKTPFDLTEIEKIPPKSIVPSIIGWGICVAVVGLIGYQFLTNGVEAGAHSIFLWSIITASFSAVGCTLAFAHPLAILAAFVSAPLATILPMFATGWSAGIVQAIIKKPTAADMENIPVDTETFKGFWRNSLTRILLVIILTNIGASIGTFVAGALIAKSIF